jgi:hypothetical protein
MNSRLSRTPKLRDMAAPNQCEARRGGRPGGGNITGVTISGGLELIGKRMGLLVEAMPKLSAVARLHQLPLDVLVELSEGMFSICEMPLSP